MIDPVTALVGLIACCAGFVCGVGWCTATQHRTAGLLDVTEALRRDARPRR